MLGRARKCDAMEANFVVGLWLIWKYRNGLIFKELAQRKDEIFDNWFMFRNSKVSTRWVLQLSNIFLAISVLFC